VKKSETFYFKWLWICVFVTFQWPTIKKSLSFKIRLKIQLWTDWRNITSQIIKKHSQTSSDDFGVCLTLGITARQRLSIIFGIYLSCDFSFWDLFTQTVIKPLKVNGFEIGFLCCITYALGHHHIYLYLAFDSIWQKYSCLNKCKVTFDAQCTSKGFNFLWKIVLTLVYFIFRSARVY